MVVGVPDSLGASMRIEPKTAGAFATGAFFFLLIFGLGWPGPGTWLLVFALLFIAAAVAAWWLDGAMVTGGGGVVMAGGGGPFRASSRRGAGRPGDSLLLSLGLPGPDGQGRWVLPDRVHVTAVAGMIGILAMIIFVGGAISGGGATTEPATVPVVQSNAALDFARPVTDLVPATTDAASGAVASTESVTPLADPQPIIVETPSTTRPAPARPLEVTSTLADPAQMFTYEVVSGDTLYDLALTYNTSIDAIMTANGIGEFDTIRVGERLLIPAGGA